jgi:hypothetical protein
MEAGDTEESWAESVSILRTGRRPISCAGWVTWKEYLISYILSIFLNYVIKKIQTARPASSPPPIPQSLSSLSLLLPLALLDISRFFGIPPGRKDIFLVLQHPLYHMLFWLWIGIDKGLCYGQRCAVCSASSLSRTRCFCSTTPPSSASGSLPSTGALRPPIGWRRATLH